MHTRGILRRANERAMQRLAERLSRAVAFDLGPGGQASFQTDLGEWDG